MVVSCYSTNPRSSVQDPILSPLYYKSPDLSIYLLYLSVAILVETWKLLVVCILLKVASSQVFFFLETKNPLRYPCWRLLLVQALFLLETKNPPRYPLLEVASYLGVLLSRHQEPTSFQLISFLKVASYPSLLLSWVWEPHIEVVVWGITIYKPGLLARGPNVWEWLSRNVFLQICILAKCCFLQVFFFLKNEKPPRGHHVGYHHLHTLFVVEC